MHRIVIRNCDWILSAYGLQDDNVHKKLHLYCYGKVAPLFIDRQILSSL